MKRLSKKLLSVVLAMALIVSCVTVCFTAFAETDNTNVYQVEFTSPAIPMVKGTQISLADIEVQLTSGGEYVSGSSLTVSDIDAGLVYNAEAGTVAVYAKGVYPITVSDGTATKTVYVVAADTADGPFNIFEYDFADFEADIAEGKGNWHLSGFKKPQTNPEKIKDVTSSIATKMQWDSSKNALVFGNYDLALWTTNDVLESFKDYTIKTTAGSTTTAYNSWRNYGVMARVIPGADETAPFDTGSKYIMIGMGPGTAQGSICRFYVGRPVYAGSWAAAKTEFYWSANTAYDYAYKFEGSTVTVSAALEGEELVEIYSYTDTNNNFPKTGGGIGVFSDDTKSYYKNLVVEIDIDELPAATAAEELYVVTEAAPAIPMNALTQVNVADLMVELDGAVYLGKNLTFAETVDYDGIKVADGLITAYEKGTYPITVTDAVSGVTDTIYVTVKNAEDTQWVLYETVFGDYSHASAENPVAFPDGWSAQGYSNMNWHDASVRYKYFDFTNVRPYTDRNNNFTGPGIVPFSNTNYSQGINLYNAPGYFILNDSVVNDFADYTISSNMVIYANSAYVNTIAAGAGLFGRAPLNNSGKLDTSVSAFKGAIVLPAAKTVDGAIQGHYVYTLNTNNNPAANTSAVGATQFKTGDKKSQWDYLGSKNNQEISLQLKYEGTTATLSSPKDSKQETFVINNVAQNTGAVGVDIMSYSDGGSATSVNVRTFKVALNNAADDMPKAIAAEPEVIEPIITIVGEGDAEVEAVVGSENTYTVELVPAEGYKVKVGSLVINGEAVIDSDKTGRVYTFTTEDLAKTIIAVEYIEDNGQFNTAMLGAQVNPEKSGIRFGSRTDSIKRAMEGATTGLLNDKIFVDGVNYDIAEIGMIMVPTQLLGDAELVVGGKYVVRQPVSKVVAVTDDFADIAISLVNIPEAQYGVKISSRMYIAYEDANGAIQYIYTEVIERSYNDVLDAMAQ